nr:MAG: hypothetical protein [Microvirus sp.]
MSKKTHTLEHTIIFSHKSEKIVPKWRNTKPTVVPGLAPTINALLAKANAGIPHNVSTRVLETQFKNMDLTDIAQLSQAYADLRQTYENKQKHIIEAKAQNEKEKHEQHKKILAYLEAQETKPVTP